MCARLLYCLVAACLVSGCDDDPSTAARGAKGKKRGTGVPTPRALAPAPASAPASAPATAPTRAGLSFAADARLLFAVAACPDRGKPPARFAAVVAAHCRQLRRSIGRYRKRYVLRARPWLKRRQPDGLPSRVVYPFGGGDLLSALTTYASTDEITTISLEHAGDVRGVRQLDARGLAKNLALLRQTIAGLLSLDDSTSKNMMKMQRTAIPGQLAFFLVALAVYQLEPVDLRYFRIEADGRLHYLDAADIAALRPQRARRLSGGWVDTTWSRAYSNAELTFRPAGASAARVAVHRHVAANLANKHVAGSPLLRHLERKGRVVSLVKAAAYLLWRRDFSRVRDYLLERADYIVSDSTGIPPTLLRRRGFTVETYGRYRACFFENRYDPKIDALFVRLWRSQRYRRLPFRFGYPDRHGSYHLMIARRGAAATQEGR